MAPRKIIIDTDPGVDDILALLLALSVQPDELELLLISVTFGNIDVRNCLRNIVSLFHHIEKEQAWRLSKGRAPGFDVLKRSKPLVAAGAERPLADQLVMADYFHGLDGLGGIHTSHPHLTPEPSTWESLFSPSQSEANNASQNVPSQSSSVREADLPTATLPQQATQQLAATAQSHHLFQPSRVPAHREILRLLRENPSDSITLVAIGPLTNLSLAATEDTATFLRVKEVVVMGGSIDCPGNVTPLGEFNCYADPLAFARVLALTSTKPASTLPPSLPGMKDSLPQFGVQTKKLPLTLFPLDITTQHSLTSTDYFRETKGLKEEGSPLAEWVSAFLPHVFAKSKSQTEGEHSTGKAEHGLNLHDPLAVFYAFAPDPTDFVVQGDEDIRVETTGQWTRGACVVDRRGRSKRESDEGGIDHGGWLTKGLGNRVARVVDTTGGLKENFGIMMVKQIFGLDQGG